MRYKLKEIAEYRNERISIEKINSDNYISTENMLPNKEGITKSSGLPNSKQVSKYKKGDILISNIRPYFKKIWLAQFDGGASNDVLIIRSKNINSAYLYFALMCDNFFEYMTATSKGTKMPRGDKHAIMEYELNVVESSAAEKIVSTLSSIEKKVEINKVIITNLEKTTSLLFKNWFIDFEFPNDNGQPYKSSGGEMVESELGMIPAKFQVNYLEFLAEIIMGQSPKGDTYNQDNEGLPLVNGATDFKNGLITPGKYTTEPKKISQENDYIFGVRATIGNVTTVDKAYAIGRGAGIARAQMDVNREFLYFILEDAFKGFSQTSTGSVYLNVSRNDLSKLKIIIPENAVLEKFHDLINPFFIKIEKLRSESRRLEDLRDTLLPKLLSGELRVPVESKQLSTVTSN